MDTRTSPIRLRISQLQELLAQQHVHALISRAAQQRQQQRVADQSGGSGQPGRAG